MSKTNNAAKKTVPDPFIKFEFGELEAELSACVVIQGYTLNVP